ncbi:PREDICTED: LOW QUALITY PROTEIN: uncharacterized protein LOC104710247 [Camelina sativa]|uniref:LOW QUALITY PROTEIN: uncharacterized protein LOC104710247 n=1 Tax=Camelina sativa TaxID=90675 RepID=A0ABM0TED0_CAMSA|nr:PREDICTED: LOW QUALITY PROTEIN: uncharacterized protein LOC104710247 [Camelina sativa]
MRFDWSSNRLVEEGPDYHIQPQFKKTVRVTSSCDGLVCFLIDNNILTSPIIVTNPAMGRSQNLPLSMTQLKYLDKKMPVPDLFPYPVFGKDSVTGTYKLVWLHDDKRNNISLCEVFDFEVKKWSSLRSLPPSSLLLHHCLPFRLPPHHRSILGLHNNNDDSDIIETKTTVLLLIAYIVVVTVFNLLAIGSIAYRVFLILGIVAFLLTKLIQIIPGLRFDYASPYFQALTMVVTVISIVAVVKLYVDWILAWVVVVVESAWGLTPLKRSKSLVKGMKSVSLSIIFFFATTESVLVWISTVAASAQLDDDDGGMLWTNAFFVVQIVITSAVLTLLMLYNLAASTVMYMYCKAVHGELAWKIAEEFAREYVSLPFDDGKVPHLVSVAYNNI